jgi:hypothetical protein
MPGKRTGFDNQERGAPVNGPSPRIGRHNDHGGRDAATGLPAAPRIDPLHG